MIETKESKWKPLFWRLSDRESVCDGCEKDINVDEVIFYFPAPKKADYSQRKGLVYCSNCIKSKIEAVIIAESI